MSNQAVETVVSTADRAKVGLAIAVFVAGMIAYYALDKGQPGYVRIAVLVGATVLAAVIAWFSGPGQRFVAFGREAWSETRRVVWPTQKETLQTTGIVIAFALVMAIFLWFVDKSLEWILYDLLLGWKK
jgi:preprotein translocase subunit SecE